MKKLMLSIIFFIHFNYLYTQSLPDRLNAWADSNRVEKVYLHLDREAYFSGQDIWFKAYFMSDFLPSSISSSLYVELTGNEGELIQREIFPVYWGVTQGQISLNHNLPSGDYTLKAYAPVMLNQSDFLFTRKIKVYGNKSVQDEKKSLPGLQINFFPEGGNLIAGLINNIAFKANDKNGFPVNTSIEIKNDAGEIITKTQSQHDGMGVFSLLPMPGESYYAIKNGDEELRYPLPESTTNGVTIQVRSSDRGIQFKIEQQENNRSFQPAYMIGQMQNRSVFSQEFKMNKPVFSGHIQTASLPSGILQLTVFNADDIPLAERLVFINNKEYILPAQLVTDSLNTKERMLNQFTLKLQDTVSGSFSVSVTDADYEDRMPRAQNIYSWFLLTSDIKGYVHRPSWYFTTRGDSVVRALDLVMLTNGWRRFNWKDVVNNTLPQPAIKGKGFITLSGKATLKDRKKPFGDQDLLLMISPNDTVTDRRKYSQIVQTDSQGNFSLDSLVFYGHSKLFFSDIRGQKSKFLEVKMDADSLRQKYHVPEQKIFADQVEHAVNQKMLTAYKSYLDGIGTILENVTVTGRLKTRLQQLDELYTSGVFSRGIMARTIDLTDATEVDMNILDYLSGRVPGISVVKHDYYHIFYRKPVSMQVIKPVMGETPTPNVLGNTTPNEMSIFLNEMPVDADYLSSIPFNEIAYIKIFPTFSGAAGGGPDGSLAVYLKKGKDSENKIENGYVVIPYKGYSIIKEFYSPDYRVSNLSENRNDNRLTLHWEPNVFVNDINPGIPVRFYNNDRTKRFKIIVEGITYDGKLLMIEKTMPE